MLVDIFGGVVCDSILIKYHYKLIEIMVEITEHDYARYIRTVADKYVAV